jgi:GNAT superfamily N-acetyltransferase
MAIVVRSATHVDADAIGRLAEEFVAYLAALGDPAPRGITADVYRRDGFGERPAFEGIVVEHGGSVVGYLLFGDGYDIDRGGRVLHVIDLFVTESARHLGAGTALMVEARDECRRRNGHALVWTVFPPNSLARQFYERLGATYPAEILMAWTTEPT